MKTNDELIAYILEARDEYELKKKKRNRVLLRTMIPAGTTLLAAGLAVAIVPNFFRMGKAAPNEEAADAGVMMNMAEENAVLTDEDSQMTKMAGKSDPERVLMSEVSDSELLSETEDQFTALNVVCPEGVLSADDLELTVMYENLSSEPADYYVSGSYIDGFEEGTWYCRYANEDMEVLSVSEYESLVRKFVLPRELPAGEYRVRVLLASADAPDTECTLTCDFSVE